MANFNRTITLGNVTRDPELRYTPSGTAVMDIGLAVNDRRKGANGEWVEEATFVDVTLWGRTAEIAAEYVKKGDPLLIEGRLKTEQWQDKEGNKRSKLKVVAESMQLLGGKGGGSQSSGSSRSSQPQSSGGSFGPPDDDVDAPF